MADAPDQIDARIPRFNQAMVAFFVAFAWVFRIPSVIVALAVILVAGLVAGPDYGLFIRFFREVLAPRLPPAEEFEDPRPPRFAATVAAVLLGAASVTLFTDAAGIGWVLALVVAFAAAFAAVTEICLACELYARLPWTSD
ncbi:MAG: DUF4395 domain-containing protein [Acidimicrobiia bacterium]